MKHITYDATSSLDPSRLPSCAATCSASNRSAGSTRGPNTAHVTILTNPAPMKLWKDEVFHNLSIFRHTYVCNSSVDLLRRSALPEPYIYMALALCPTRSIYF